MTADCSRRRGDISKPQPASKCYFIVFSQDASLKPRDPNWHVHVHLDAKSDADKETFNGCFLKRNIYRTNLHSETTPRNKNFTAPPHRPPRMIIEQNPIFPNNEAITVVNVWLIFIDVAHLAVQCKRLEKAALIPSGFYEFKMQLNESQNALCCSELFLFIIHEKMKTFTAGHGLMIWARRMVFLADWPLVFLLSILF